MRLRETKKKLLDSVPTLLRLRSSSANADYNSFDFLRTVDDDFSDFFYGDCADGVGCSPLLEDGMLTDLGRNASVSYSVISRAAGDCARPLDFPAPTVERATTASSYVRDHNTGEFFFASSVLMRGAVHARNCCRRTGDRCGGSCGGCCFRGPGGFDAGQHEQPDSIGGCRSWHSGDVSSSLSPSSTDGHDGEDGSHNRHRRTCSNPTHRLACNIPSRAYCVRRKLCDTIYGSIRLCIVLRRARPRNGVSVEDSGWETTDQMVVIKVVKWAKYQGLRGRHLEDPIKEVAALQLIGDYHPNVASIVEALQDDRHLFCVLPYFSGGDFYIRILDEARIAERPKDTGIDEPSARAWFRQLMESINHLQKKGVCHRDITMENLLVDDKGRLRIIDFGLCLRVPYADPANRNLTATDVSANTHRKLIKAQGQGGDWAYMAPEIAERRPAFDGFAADIWSAGVVLFVMLVGKHPFTLPQPVDPNFCRVAMEGDLVGLLWERDVRLSPAAVHLLQAMLRVDPADRPTLAEIADHPWVGRGYLQRPRCETDSPGVSALGGAVGDATGVRWFLGKDSVQELDEDGSVPPMLLNRLRLESNSSSCSSDCEAAEHPMLEVVKRDSDGEDADVDTTADETVASDERPEGGDKPQSLDPPSKSELRSSPSSSPNKKSLSSVFPDSSPSPSPNKKSLSSLFPDSSPSPSPNKKSLSSLFRDSSPKKKGRVTFSKESISPVENDAPSKLLDMVESVTEGCSCTGESEKKKLLNRITACLRPSKWWPSGGGSAKIPSGGATVASELSRGDSNITVNTRGDSTSTVTREEELLRGRKGLSMCKMMTN